MDLRGIKSAEIAQAIDPLKSNSQHIVELNVDLDTKPAVYVDYLPKTDLVDLPITLFPSFAIRAGLP